MFDYREILSVTLILFSIIDIVGNIPIVINLQEKGKIIEARKATIVSGLLMIVFMFVGEAILKLFGVDIGAFAIAGGIVIFIIGLEMILGIEVFKDSGEYDSPSIFPIAFPMIAGAGTLTTILSLKAEYHNVNLILGIILNLIVIYIVLKSSKWLQQKLGSQGATILRKIFGIILLAISIKLIKTNWAMI